jgi:hypothetical protein
VAAQIELFERLKCKTLLSPRPQPTPITSIIECHPMQLVELPDLDTLLDKEYPHFEFNKTFDEVRNQPLFVV